MAQGDILTTGFAQGLYDVSATQMHPLGTMRVTEDGREFRYARNGAVALAAGTPTESMATVAGQTTMFATAAFAIGSKTLTFTNNATAVTTNQYKEGYLIVSVGTAIGTMYRVESNAAESTGSGTLTVTLKDPLRVALDTTSGVDLIYNPFDLLVVSTATTKFPSSIPVVAVPISYYYWTQIGGVACSIITTTSVVGSKMSFASGKIEISDSYADNTACVQIALVGIADNAKAVWLTGI